MVYIMEEIGNNQYPNHIYFLNERKNKLLAYINSVTGEPKIFTKPLSFDVRSREFELIEKRKI